MQGLKAQLQQAQVQAGADPKSAKHAWKAADQFYNAMLKAGMAWKPNWSAIPKGAATGYDGDYNTATKTPYAKPVAAKPAAAKPAAGNTRPIAKPVVNHKS